VARLDLDVLGAHALAMKRSRSGLNRPVFGGDRIEAGLRPPGRPAWYCRRARPGGTAPARHRGPWLSLQAGRPRNRARKRFLGEAPLIAVENDCRLTPGAWGTSSPAPCNPRPHPAPAPRHRREAETLGCVPASVTIIPENGMPDHNRRASCRASTRSAEATASCRVVNGFCHRRGV